MGDNSTLKVIFSDGKLLVCGSNEKGQLGIGSTENVSVLTPVKPLEGEIIRRAVGGWDFSVVMNGILVYMYLQQIYTIYLTKLHLPGDPRIVDITAGLRHVVAVSDKGQLYTWGGRIKERVQQKDKKSQNQDPVIDKGQLYTWGGRIKERVQQKEKKSLNHAPVIVSLPQIEGKIIQVGAGSYHSAALTDCGEIICWGDNKYGQLAQSRDTVRNISDLAIIPVTLFDGKFIDIQTGWTHLAAMTGERLQAPGSL